VNARELAHWLAAAKAEWELIPENIRFPGDEVDQPRRRHPDSAWPQESLLSAGWRAPDVSEGGEPAASAPEVEAAVNQQPEGGRG
jgi:hypothetical protein